MPKQAFESWYESHGKDTHIVWEPSRDLTAVTSEHLKQFRIAENFFLDKQLFFGGKEAIPSYPPQRRGHLQKETSVTFKFGSRQNETLVLNNICVLLAYFNDQKILTVFLFTTLPSLSVDRLIFLKQAKWYRIGDKGWSLTLDKPKPASVHSVHELMFELLASYGLALPETERAGESAAWPIFDFINLRDVCPSMTKEGNGELKKPHTSNWEGARELTRAQHLGLLVGDEGYRLIDKGAASHYAGSLEDANTQLRGRDYFLYQFAATSCLAFYAPNIADTKTNWANWYKDQIGHVPILDSYIRLVPEVPCLADGVPLRVEVCLLRYIVLWGISRDLETKARLTSRFWQWVLRGFTLTPLEKAIHALERLDLYQDSALWIIGGPYADQLYQYSAIRERIDRSVRNIQLAESEINRTRLILLCHSADGFNRAALCFR